MTNNQRFNTIGVHRKVLALDVVTDEDATDDVDEDEGEQGAEGRPGLSDDAAVEQRRRRTLPTTTGDRHLDVGEQAAVDDPGYHLKVSFMSKGISLR